MVTPNGLLLEIIRMRCWYARF